MKKQTAVKKIVSIVLAFVLIMGLAVPVFANENLWTGRFECDMFLVEGENGIVAVTDPLTFHAEISNVTSVKRMPFMRRDHWDSSSFLEEASTIFTTAPTTITLINYVNPQFEDTWFGHRLGLIDMDDPGGYNFIIDEYL